MAAKGREAYNYYKYNGTKSFTFPNRRSERLDVCIEPDSNFGIRKSGSGKELRLTFPWTLDPNPTAYTITGEAAAQLIAKSTPYQAGHIPSHTRGDASRDNKHLLKV